MDPRLRPPEPTDSITALFELQYTRLCRLAFLLTGEDGRAEEIVMEAFVRSIARWRSVREPETYVRRAVVNLCRNRRRRAWTERHAPTPGEAASPPPEPMGEVWTAVTRLPPRQRAAVVLRYWDDISEADIASVLGCSTGTVKSQLAKARASLERALAVQEDT
ncbi:MAG: SigE family RNA polymerase sigma factor [Acidimicrobiales bacterium]